jgi:NADH:ubiquinone oxidoreductase subunit C
MLKDELKAKITELLAAATCEEGGEWLAINVGADSWLAFAQQLRNDAALWFDYLFCLTCIDWKTQLTMVYFLTSTKYRHNIEIKIKLDRNSPEIETVSHIWRTADFNEREVYELFGVNFLNHPDLRLLILPD